MDVRGQEGVAVADRHGAGRPLADHLQDAPRWGAPAMLGLCQATAALMAVVRLTPKVVGKAAVSATDARHAMAAGSARAVVIVPVIGSLSGLGIVSMIERVIARKSGLAIARVPTTGIRTPPVRTLKTTARGQDVFAIATTVMETVGVPGMNGANRPNAPDPVTTRAVLSAQMQHRRPQQPYPQQTI
ncbi:hypothetical protein KR52_10820 [Synechococcus sp. KORDI-52]|nr:hypothetical protein KR52_10820 [Synechococcus sp. KORDI-52]